MPNEEYSRRTVLRRSLATAGAGALVSTAGCSSIPNPLGGGAPYASWLPDPDEIGDSDHYRFNYFNLGEIESNEDNVDDFEGSELEEFWSPLDIDWEDVSNLTAFGPLFGLSTLAIEADYNKDDQISTLEDEDYDEDSEYNGYTIMLSDNEEDAVALNGNAVITTSATDDSGDGTPEGGDTDKVETVIDAKKGNVDRYQQANEDMKALTSALGGGTVITGRTTDEPDEATPADGDFENMVAKGSSSKINGDTVKEKWVVVYDSEDDVDQGDLEDWVDENSDDDQEFADVEDISYNTNRRKGIVTGKTDADDF